MQNMCTLLDKQCFTEICKLMSTFSRKRTRRR